MATSILGGHDAVRVAIVQTPPVYLDLAASVRKACDRIREAAGNGARLIAFPEAWLPGFPAWPEGPDSLVLDWSALRIRLYDNALLVPGEATRQLCEVAAETRCTVVMGCQELDSAPRSHTLYDTLLVIDDAGRIVGRHRKLTPTHSEKAIWGVGDGASLTTHETGVGRVGGLICGENVSGLFRGRLIEDGQDIHVMAFPAAAALEGPRLYEPDTVGTDFFGYHLARTHALEAGCFVLLACGYYTRDDYPDDLPLRDRMFLDDYRGGSCVFAPGGMPLTEPTYGDTILYADCPADMVKISKAVIDTGGHYARPDVVRLDWRARPTPVGGAAA